MISFYFMMQINVSRKATPPPARGSRPRRRWFAMLPTGGTLLSSVLSALGSVPRAGGWVTRSNSLSGDATEPTPSVKVTAPATSDRQVHRPPGYMDSPIRRHRDRPEPGPGGSLRAKPSSSAHTCGLRFSTRVVLASAHVRPSLQHTRVALASSHMWSLLCSFVSTEQLPTGPQR